jgi:hypothetical protein
MTEKGCSAGPLAPHVEVEKGTGGWAGVGETRGKESS